MRENKKLWKEWTEELSEAEKLKLICDVGWKSEEPAVKRRWKLIQEVVEKRIRASKLDPAHVKVYRDSVIDPDFFKMQIELGIEPDVFKDLDKFGATFMHTEDKKLHEKNVIEDRDGYIAKNINKTLNDGETGFLFIGLGHEIEKHLSRYPSIKYDVIFKKTDWPKSVTG